LAGPIPIRIHFPVAAREIRVAAHDRAIYRGRVIIAATALLATVWIVDSFFHFTRQTSSVAGVQIFAFQAWAAFIFACGAFTATVDSISREKREGTLGLLFLTHLKGRDVILGKLISALSLFVSGAIAALPILTLPILLGGIRLSQSFHLLVSLLSTMLLSAAAGLVASSVSANKQKSAGLAVLIMLFFCLVIPISIFSLRKVGALEIAYVLEFFTPVFPQQLAAGALAGLQIQYFWTSIATIFSISCGLLAAASFITPRTWQQRAKDPLLTRLIQRHASWTLRTINSRSTLGRALLDRNAYEWLAARQLSAATKTWTFIGAILLLAAALILNFIRHNQPSAVLITICIPAAYLIQMNAKIRVGGHACDRFSLDRESNALELILCTPLAIPQMIAGEFAALRRHYFWPSLAVTALLFVGLGLSLQGLDQLSQLFTQGPSTAFRLRGLAIILCAILFLFLDSAALAWAGSWSALASRKLQHARGNAMALVLAGPLILFGAIMPIIAQSSYAREFVNNIGFNTSLFLIVIFVAACNLTIIFFTRRWLLRSARQRLTNPDLYSRASQPFLAFFRTKPDSKAPLNLGKAAKAR
jgi:hypothetical protein